MTIDNLWAIVLAGGEGTRLASTTRALYGRALPKQFAAFGQPRTFIQATVDRLLPLVPPERIVVVVASAFETLARNQLAEFAGIEIVPQPSNAGTGPGVLLPLAHVLRRSANADVALVPSDHAFERPAALRAALGRGQRACRALASGMVLLGAQADHPATDLGWVLRGQAQPGGSREVVGFVEKPEAPEARRLYERGALWNTMLAVARARSLWRVARAALPIQTEALEPYLPEAGTQPGRRVLERIYESLPSADFSRDVLAAASGLGAIALEDAGWSDCGTPQRLRAAFGQSQRRSGVFLKGAWPQPGPLGEMECADRRERAAAGE